MDANAIFDAASKASKFILWQDAINTKTAHINSVLSKRCGHCQYWMTRSCIPEKEHGQFKSCDSVGCRAFTRCSWTEELAEKLRLELDDLTSKNSTGVCNGGVEYTEAEHGGNHGDKN